MSEEVFQSRVAACSTCEYQRSDKKGAWCRLCGCKTSASGWRILNLAAYNERLPEWGCKHPRRAAGEGWKR